MRRIEHDGGQRRTAIYQQIMATMLERIQRGEFCRGDKIPSEHQLVDELGVSRMTVNRALTELAARGYINRVQGVGSFVADSRSQSSLLEVPDIAADVRQRGRRHHARVLSLREQSVDAEIAAALELCTGDLVFYSLLLHHEDDVPIQLEQRYVRQSFAPGYLQQNFRTRSPYQFLIEQGEIQEVEHTLYAAASTPSQQKSLDLAAGEPCLVLIRRTWSNNEVVTFGRFYYPGERYRLFSHYPMNNRR
ncbi:MAG: histidine utilization repressor [Gammaproteobacteria bacterium]|nr:histidine utilization repressor [Gammaproteobacteria bacterium]